MNKSAVLILSIFATLFTPSSSIECYDCSNNRNISCRLDYMSPDRGFSRYECTFPCNRTINCTNPSCQSVISKVTYNDYYKVLLQSCQRVTFQTNATCATYSSRYFANSTYIHQLFTQDYTNTSHLPPDINFFPYAVCGCNTSFCNNKILFSFTHDATTIFTTDTKNTTSTPVYTSLPPPNTSKATLNPLLPLSHLSEEYFSLIALVVLPALMMACLLIGSILLCRSYKKRSKFSSYQLTDKTDGTQHEMATLSSPDGFYEDPELARVPILTGLKLEDLIGSGKYGHVWRCVYEGREMACKVWLPCEVNAWRSERAIFSQETTYHPNIVRYIHSGFIEERGDDIELKRKGVLLMELCDRGSLSNFLETSTLSWEMASRFSFEIASGISYLHSHTGLTRADKGYAQVPKCPIAHRDIKSSNVLIRSNMTCCISDLGLAMALNPNHSEANFANAGQVGTPFYMAPEALAARINLSDLDSFKQMDVFSMGLVLWEIFSRCEVEGGPAPLSEHKIPFSDVHPSLLQSSRISRVELILQLKEMHENPIEDLLPIPPAWRDHPLLSKARHTILDCTYKEPEARITAGTVSGRFQENNIVQKKQIGQESGLCESIDFGSFASMSSLMKMIENQRLSRITCDNYSQLPEYSV